MLLRFIAIKSLVILNTGRTSVIISGLYVPWGKGFTVEMVSNHVLMALSKRFFTKGVSAKQQTPFFFFFLIFQQRLSQTSPITTAREPLGQTSHLYPFHFLGKDVRLGETSISHSYWWLDWLRHLL